MCEIALCAIVLCEMSCVVVCEESDGGGGVGGRGMQG